MGSRDRSSTGADRTRVRAGRLACCLLLAAAQVEGARAAGAFEEGGGAAATRARAAAAGAGAAAAWRPGAREATAATAAVRPTTAPIAAGDAPVGSDSRPAAARAIEATVEVRLLQRHAPRALEIERMGGEVAHVVRLHGDALLVDGAPAASIDLPHAAWRVRGASFDRVYEGALRIRAGADAIEVRALQPIERWVADVVAAESEPETPPAALRALAVVVRSRALAGPGPHDGAFCDMAHCQITAGAAHGSADHRAAARAAAAATAGAILVVDGGPADALFHAACGGHTADPAEIFGGADRSGAAAVADPGCSAPWSASLPLDRARGVAEALLGDGAAIERLQLRRGVGGFVVAVRDPATGRSIRGEAFARSLDRAAGLGEVRSPRFDLRVAGGRLVATGAGHGHGAGLCQRGAARMARAGAGHEAILARFFPRARIVAAR